jgi:CTP:molybdopterin cytidylyltransferase MocA
MKITAIVLAAGKSSRMGTNKLLLELDGKTVLDHILNNLRYYDTIVVTGHRPEDIKPIIERHGARAVHNPDYEKGMTTSFQAGLKALNPEVNTVYMVLSDTFGFKYELLDKMEEKMASTTALLVSPVYAGKRGHPVLVAYELFDEFLALGDDETMKDVVVRHEHEHEYVEGDIWTRIDLDTPEDYEKVKRLWATR